MTSREDDILVRLQNAIGAWSDEVTLAQDQLSRQISETRDQLARLIKVLAARNQNGHALADALSDVEQLRRALELREQALREETDRRQALEAELSALRPRLEIVEERQRQAEVRCADLAAELAEARARHRIEEDALRDARNEIAALKEGLQERDQTVRTATESVARLTESLNIFRAEQEATRRAADEAEQRRETLEAELRDAHERLAAAKTAVRDTQALDELRMQLESRERALQQTRDELEALRRSSESAARSQRELLEELDRLREQLTQRDAELRTARAEIDAFREQAAAKAAEKNAHVEELLALRDRVQADEEALRLAREELDGVRGRHEEAVRKLESAREEARRAVGEVEVLKTELAKARMVAKEKAELAAALEDVRERVMRDNDALKKEVEDWRGRAAEIESERERRIHEQEARLAQQEEALKKFEDEMQSLLKQTNESAGSGDQLAEALAQIDKLKTLLAQRDAEIEMLREADEVPGALRKDEQQRIAAATFDAQGRRRAMGEILVNAGIIAREQLESALEEQKSSKQRRLGTILVEKGLVREEIIAQVLASQLNLPYVSLSREMIQPEACERITGQFATHHMCMPVRVENDALVVAMANPHDLLAIEDIELSTGLRVVPVVSTLAEITSAIVRHYGAWPARGGVSSVHTREKDV